jgi:hypothetical protein
MMRHLIFSLDARQSHNLSAAMSRSIAADAPTPATRQEPPQCYSTHVPAALLRQQSDLIEQLKGFARTIGARRLEVYVRDDE